MLADIDATGNGGLGEAAKYVPDQLQDVQSKLAALQASFDKQDYAAVVMGAPAVLGAAQSLATAAAAKKDEVLKALNDKWTALAGTLPGYVTAIQSRIDFLGKKANKETGNRHRPGCCEGRGPAMRRHCGPRLRPRSPRATWKKR